MARQHAKPENSYASLQSQIDDLARRIEVLEGQSEIEPEPIDEYTFKELEQALTTNNSTII